MVWLDIICCCVVLSRNNIIIQWFNDNPPLYQLQKIAYNACIYGNIKIIKLLYQYIPIELNNDTVLFSRIFKRGDIDTIKIALNDSISDIKAELKEDIKEKKKIELLDYKNKYLRVIEKLDVNSSIYSLSETELDIVAGGLNDSIQLLEEILTDDLTDQEKEETINVKNDCLRLVELLAG